MSEYLQHPLMSLQFDVRRAPVWSFQSLDRLTKNDLYFRHQTSKRKANPTACPAESSSGVARNIKRKVDVAGISESRNHEDDGKEDNYAMLFGRVDPKHIPESGAWWETRQTDLMAISDDHEMGLMTGMVTITQNDFIA